MKIFHYPKQNLPLSSVASQSRKAGVTAEYRCNYQYIAIGGSLTNVDNKQAKTRGGLRDQVQPENERERDDGRCPRRGICKGGVPAPRVTSEGCYVSGAADCMGTASRRWCEMAALRKGPRDGGEEEEDGSWSGGRGGGEEEERDWAKGDTRVRG